jgi:hypothetical protein
VTLEILTDFVNSAPIDLDPSLTLDLCPASIQFLNNGWLNKIPNPKPYI